MGGLSHRLRRGTHHTDKPCPLELGQRFQVTGDIFAADRVVEPGQEDHAQRMLPLAQGVKIIARHRGGVVGETGDARPHKMFAFHTAMHILSIITKTSPSLLRNVTSPDRGAGASAPERSPYKKIHTLALWQASGGCNAIKRSRPVVCGNQTYPYGQVGALSPDSRFLIEPPWSTHGGEVCNPPENSGLPLND